MSKYGELLSLLKDRTLLQIRAATNFNETLHSNGEKFTLSPGHRLNLHQKYYPLYDRFLPFLAYYLAADDVVIDVGANCGDTVAGMFAANPSLRYVAIEPHDDFFAMLQENVGRIAATHSSLKVNLVKSLVGRSVESATLSSGRGTANATTNGDTPPTHTSQTLDAIMAKLDIDTVRLLKSDVDGYDFDVLDSATATLERSQPIVFFESQIDHEFQRDGFAKAFETLERLGYCYWVLFDNYGSVVAQMTDRVAVSQLVEYPWRKRQETVWNTINYFDVLAVTAKDRPFAEKVVEDYMRSNGRY